MPRQRMLHPNFFTDAELLSLPALHRVLFAGLWCWADKRGVLEDKPTEIKIRVLPADNCDVAAMLADLVRIGRLRKFEANGKRWLHVRRFLDYQHPHKNEQDNGFPEPPPDDDPPLRKFPESTTDEGGGNRAVTVTVTESVSKSVTDLLSPTPLKEPEPTGSQQAAGREKTFWEWCQEKRRARRLKPENHPSKDFDDWLVKYEYEYGRERLERCFEAFLADPWSHARNPAGKPRNATVALFISDGVFADKVLATRTPLRVVEGGATGVHTAANTSGVA